MLKNTTTEKRSLSINLYSPTTAKGYNTNNNKEKGRKAAAVEVVRLADQKGG